MKLDAFLELYVGQDEQIIVLIDNDEYEGTSQGFLEYGFSDRSEGFDTADAYWLSNVCAIDGMLCIRVSL